MGGVRLVPCDTTKSRRSTMCPLNPNCFSADDDICGEWEVLYDERWGAGSWRVVLGVSVTSEADVALLSA